ncbi:MAG: antibiotic biosynthesis monooxygenase [Candidatus Sericytochromatia bacterium]
MFIVIYQWQIKEAKEPQFIENWEKLTNIIYKKFGSLGSRLHKVSDNHFLAYAQWPNKELWEKEHIFSDEDKAILLKMSECIKKSFETITSNVVSDLLRKEIN